MDGKNKQQQQNYASMAKTVNCPPVSILFFLPLVIDTSTPAQGILAYSHPAEDYLPFPMSP